MAHDYLVCGVHALEQMLPSPKDAVADSLSKYLLVCLVMFSCAMLPMTIHYKEAAADSIWVQSTIATTKSDYFTVDSMV